MADLSNSIPARTEAFFGIVSTGDSGDVTVHGDLTVEGAVSFDTALLTEPVTFTENVTFEGTLSPDVKPTVDVDGSDAAQLAELLTALDTIGLIEVIDSGE